ncbi:MAG TPA: hypothetical protein VM532_05720 [Burkholderiales bacterium]|nr:hypothetical protein [Burkholderiales bacterium]
MLPNGLVVTLEMALRSMGASSIRTDATRQAALLLGMFREDVIVLRPFGLALPSPSFGHLWPRSKKYCNKRFDIAVKVARAEGPLAGDFQLGRALHVLIDMACPAHAIPIAHYLKDPFERYVDAHASKLSTLSVAEFTVDRSATPGDLVSSLAEAARTLWNQKSDGLEKRVPIAEQARHLIPLAAAHVCAMVALYEREVRDMQYRQRSARAFR